MDNKYTYMHLAKEYYIFIPFSYLNITKSFSISDSETKQMHGTHQPTLTPALTPAPTGCWQVQDLRFEICD